MTPDDDTRPISVGGWFFTLLILAIPVVNIVMYFIWAFVPAGNINRRNYCRAVLLWFVLGIVLTAIFLFALGGLALLTNAGHAPR